jgi:hypothetical protein
MTQGVAKVHLDGQEVVTLAMKKRYAKVEKFGKTAYILKAKYAAVNGKRVKWKTAEKVWVECLRAGVIPEMDCGV